MSARAETHAIASPPTDWLVILIGAIAAVMVALLKDHSFVITVAGGLAVVVVAGLGVYLHRGPAWKLVWRRFQFRFRKCRRTFVNLEQGSRSFRVEIEPRLRAATINAFDLRFVSCKSLWREAPPVPHETVRITACEWVPKPSQEHVVATLRHEDYSGGYCGSFAGDVDLKTDVGLDLRVTVEAGYHLWSGYLSFAGDVRGRDARAFGRIRASTGPYSRLFVWRAAARNQWLRVLGWFRQPGPRDRLSGLASEHAVVDDGGVSALSNLAADGRRLMRRSPLDIPECVKWLQRARDAIVEHVGRSDSERFVDEVGTFYVEAEPYSASIGNRFYGQMSGLRDAMARGVAEIEAMLNRMRDHRRD